MMRPQRTIRESITIEGIGLHSGASVRVAIHPAQEDAGITFVRTDLGGKSIRALARYTAATSYATTLSRNGASVSTVEHLLAALAAMGIDNVAVELDGEEVPVLDGSAGPFVRLIDKAGIVDQGRPRSFLKMVRPLIVRDGGKHISVWPAERPAISFFIDFAHPLLKGQSLTYAAMEHNFLHQIAHARTFGFLKDTQALRAMGLAQGASLENAIVLDNHAVLNPGGLRYPDEFVRHKILDLIGDLALLGMPLVGHVVAHRSGHGLNARLVAKLLENPHAWVIVGEADSAARPAASAYQYQAAL